MDLRLVGIPIQTQTRYYYNLDKDVDEYFHECSICEKQPLILYNNVKESSGYACIECLKTSPIGKYNFK